MMIRWSAEKCAEHGIDRKKLTSQLRRIEKLLLELGDNGGCYLFGAAGSAYVICATGIPLLIHGTNCEDDVAVFVHEITMDGGDAYFASEHDEVYPYPKVGYGINKGLRHDNESTD